MWYSIKSYIPFLLKSKNKHGVHSPFVYDLITKGFKAKITLETNRLFKAYRKQLLQSKESIEVTDFGSGSRVFKSNTRKISDIGKHAGTPLFKQQFLYRVATYLDFKNTLELGTSLAMGSIALARAKNNQVVSIEGCPQTAQTAEKYLCKFHIKNVQIKNGLFEELIPKLSATWDAVFIDGNHSYKSTIAYFDLLLPYLHNDSVLIFDDIYWSKEMTLAWKELVKHPKITVSIDLFHFGLLFFRKEQLKESFMIRM